MLNTEFMTAVEGEQVGGGTKEYTGASREYW